MFIINALNDIQLLNKKSELINACYHQNKLLLKSLKKKKIIEQMTIITEQMTVWVRNLIFRVYYTIVIIYIYIYIYIYIFLF